eukprot:CAMPEP_0179942792 /NCGR_PEP_ID=MMETSP0983-20121128/17880_1 /TAXON_ID=483367 /ORGANISM="non described non described, Strain CCMP 2436" /LENGTH=69 /DNA_ID=CAMNT_0021850267 /DNA_START=578 /DNA_END=787 /DNA_ORIENTATION=-
MKPKREPTPYEPPATWGVAHREETGAEMPVVLRAPPLICEYNEIGKWPGISSEQRARFGGERDEDSVPV